MQGQVAVTAWMIWAGVGVATVAILGIYFAACWKMVGSRRTYIVEDDEGYRREMRRSGLIWFPFEWLLHGSNAPSFAFASKDRTTGQVREVALLDRRSGAVDLKKQICKPRGFIVQTTDDHHMNVEAEVAFRLKLGLLEHTYLLADFGDALETAIQGAFRTAIGAKEDQQLRQDHGLVVDDIMRELKTFEGKPKKKRSGKKDDALGEAESEGLSLGVEFLSADFSFTEIAPVDANSYFPRPSVVAGAPPSPAGAPPGPAGAPPSPRPPSGSGVLSLPPTSMDRIADSFRGRDPSHVEALLRILEMQTRQNIAEALVNSGSLVVISADEIGLNGGTVLREKIRQGAAAHGKTAAGADGKTQADAADVARDEAETLS